MKCKNAKKDKNELLYDTGLEIFKKRITYIEYLKLFRDMENLKNLLFTKEQKILFGLISKPILSIDENNNIFKDQSMNEEEDFYCYDTLQIALKYLLELTKTPDLKTELDKRLIERLDQD